MTSRAILHERLFTLRTYPKTNQSNIFLVFYKRFSSCQAEGTIFPLPSFLYSTTCHTFRLSRQNTFDYSAHSTVMNEQEFNPLIIIYVAVFSSIALFVSLSPCECTYFHYFIIYLPCLFYVVFIIID